MKRYFNKKYMSMSMYAIFTICIVILFEKIIGNLSVVSKYIDIWWTNFIAILLPFIYGFVIAYVLKPAVVWFENKVYGFITKKIKSGIIKKKILRVLSIVTVYALIISAVTLVLNFIIPQIIDNGKDSINELPQQIEQFKENVKGNYNIKIDITYYDIEDYIKTEIEKVTKDFDQLQMIGLGISKKAFAMLKILMGIIISFYVLMDKESIAYNFKRMVKVIFSRKMTHKILNFIKMVDDVFEKFIIGKALDSLIIGLLCYIGLSALDFRYALIGSVIIGITNMIPYFGPIFGGIPVIILALINGGLGYAFCIGIFVLILQQFDGIFLGPMILGDLMGIKPLWIIFSILVGGYVMGVLGMFIGVPVFAVIRAIVINFMDKKHQEINTNVID